MNTVCSQSQKKLKRVAGTTAIIIILVMLSSCSGQEASENTFQTVTASSGVLDIASQMPSSTITKQLPSDSASPIDSPIPTFTQTPAPTPGYVGQAVCIADESMNIRSKAGTDGEIIGTLPAGETANVIEYYDEWANIEYAGFKGYVSRDYIIGLRAPEIEVPFGDWAVVLVNQTHSIPKDYPVELAKFRGGQVDSRISEICEQMFSDAEEDGVDLLVDSAYRSYDYQNKLFQKKVNSYTGYTREKAEDEAATITARPGTSEHQTGLAIDIITPSYTKLNKGFAETKAYKWLNANAQNYGFILRYPEDKTDITGIIYEPWHWRFVGTDAAKAVKESGKCWEEYIDSLS